MRNDMTGIHVIDLSKGDSMDAIDRLLAAFLGVDPQEEARTMPLREKTQEDMRAVLFKQGDELNDKVQFLKRLLQLTSDLITLINEDHIKEDGDAFITNRLQQAAVSKKMIEVMEQMRKVEPQTAEKANGQAGS
jgi:hypothetical protein